ncbi:hypothetical protein BFP97_01550 [Roseivirga sp. 4D4]|nr:hypothetical protein BFP97_01550 [Roseivirga sp. 4D4]
MLIGVIKFQRLNYLQRLVFIIVLIALVNEALATYLRMRGVNNLWVYHLFVPCTFLVVLRIYKRVFEEVITRRVFNAISIGFLLFAVLNSLFIQPLDVFNSNTITVSSVLYILLSITYFHQLLRGTALLALERTPMFWLNTGVLIYYSGTLLLYVMVNYVAGLGETAKVSISLWALNILFNIILNVFYALALWVSPQK